PDQALPVCPGYIWMAFNRRKHHNWPRQRKPCRDQSVMWRRTRLCTQRRAIRRSQLLHRIPPFKNSSRPIRTTSRPSRLIPPPSQVATVAQPAPHIASSAVDLSHASQPLTVALLRPAAPRGGPIVASPPPARTATLPVDIDACLAAATHSSIAPATRPTVEQL